MPNKKIYRLRAALSLVTAVVFGCLLVTGPHPVTASEQQRACQAERPLVFGFLPLVSVEQLVMRFSPLVDYMSVKLGVPVRLETAPDFVEFARRTHEDQRYDILFTAPHFYSQAYNKAGYELVASVDSPGMQAIIVVPKHSPIRTVHDLKGKRIATVPPMGLATLLVREYLFDAGIDPDVDLMQIITPSHDASLLSSFHGVTDASALMRPPFDAANEGLRNSMRVVAETRSTPHMPISVGRWVSDSCAADISALLLDMTNTPEGREVLRHNGFSGFKAGAPEVYEELNKSLFR